MVDNPPNILTIGETAEYLRISVSSLYKLAQESRIPCQKVGRHWRFRRESIDRWLDKSEVPHQNSTVEIKSINRKGAKQ
jgi:excisionase family DNA binding protein